MSMRKMFQLAVSLTLLIGLIVGGGMGAWAAASNQEPAPQESEWEPTPWPYPIPPTGTPYCPPQELTPEERDWEPTPWPAPLGPSWTPPPLETPYDGQVYVPEPTPGKRDWEPTPWPAPLGPPWTPPLLETPYDGQVYVPPDGAGVKTQEGSEVPAGDVGIAAISSSGVGRPYRSGLDAHGRAWTQARHEPGRITWVLVDVWLWWWDGTRWIHVGTGFDSESQPCWRGLITAEGLARWFNARTGWYVVESLHRVYVAGARTYTARRFSEQVWLTFP
jgi:hypothetical protein